ncbi:MAG: hypothetical protein ACK5KT_08370 [Dysgonomonas sp.]
MKGGFGDNYYYQMTDFIRKFKGVNTMPISKRESKMKIDGKTDKWNKINNTYIDDIGDITHRNHAGWGRIKNYSDNTGRNDIIQSKVSCDGKNIYFYVKTVADITPYTDKNWMRLFIEVNDSSNKNWEGFSFVINNKIKNDKETFLQKSSGGWNWQDATVINYKINRNEMELAIPLSSLNITDKKFSISFKWIDNAVANGDIIECIDKGDTAPNGRFRYQFVYEN